MTVSDKEYGPRIYRVESRNIYHLRNGRDQRNSKKEKNSLVRTRDMPTNWFQHASFKLQATC